MNEFERQIREEVWETYNSECGWDHTKLEKLLKIVAQAKAELDEILPKEEKALDWLYHTGRIKEEIERWRRRWLGKGYP